MSPPPGTTGNTTRGGAEMATILTDKRVRMLQGTGKPYRAFDLLVPGFHVQVSAKRHKAFCLAYRVNEKKRFQKLGEYPYLTSDWRKRGNGQPATKGYWSPVSKTSPSTSPRPQSSWRGFNYLASGEKSNGASPTV